MFILLNRDTFRNAVFERDNYKCVVCGETAVDAHHIIERKLFDDGGYYIDNGVSLCGKHHLEAEMTVISKIMINGEMKYFLMVNVYPVIYLMKNLFKRY